MASLIVSLDTICFSLYHASMAVPSRAFWSVEVGDTSGGRHSVMFGRRGVRNFVSSFGGLGRVWIMFFVLVMGRVVVLVCILLRMGMFEVEPGQKSE